MSYAELCSQCGNQMTVIPNPSPDMVKSTGGYNDFKRAVLDFNGSFDINNVQMAFCNTCDCSALLGPKVIVEGTIVD